MLQNSHVSGLDKVGGGGGGGRRVAHKDVGMVTSKKCETCDLFAYSLEFYNQPLHSTHVFI
jgi:hypothetical protein